MELKRRLITSSLELGTNFKLEFRPRQRSRFYTLLSKKIWRALRYQSQACSCWIIYYEPKRRPSIDLLNIIFLVCPIWLPVFSFFSIIELTRIGCRNRSWYGFDTTSIYHWMGSNPRPFDHEPSALPLDHSFCYSIDLFSFIYRWQFHSTLFKKNSSKANPKRFVWFLNHIDSFS